MDNDLSKMQPDEAAKIISEMERLDAVSILSQMQPDEAAKIISEMERFDAVSILSQMQPDEAAKIISERERLDAVPILSQMQPNKAAKIISVMELFDAVSFLTKMKSFDVKFILERLDLNKTVAIFEHLDTTVAADFLLTFSLQDTLYNQDGSKRAAQILTQINREKASSIFSMMDKNKKHQGLIRGEIKLPTTDVNTFFPVSGGENGRNRTKKKRFRGKHKLSRYRRSRIVR